MGPDTLRPPPLHKSTIARDAGKVPRAGISPAPRQREAARSRLLEWGRPGALRVSRATTASRQLGADPAGPVPCRNGRADTDNPMGAE